MLLDLVNKMMLSGTSSSADRRKVKKAIACISTLLPVRDDRIHFFHKSVKDWLIETSMYGQHDFTVDETEGHGTLSKLCAHELDDIKWKSVESAKFSDTAKYALKHGVQHMLYSEEDARVCEVVVKEYVVALELVYARLCVSNPGTAEDILWIQKLKISQDLSEDIKGMLNALMFVIRKYMYTYYNTFTNHLHVFLQTVLNEGGTALSHLASNLLQEKYLEKAFMEYLHKQTQPRDLIARFECSSQVACFDVSPQLDYMVCECKDGTIQLWSLHTVEQVWVRPVIVLKNCWDDVTALRKSPSSPEVSWYHSVVFHPEENIVLPGVLSHAYTFEGYLKPLFPQSLCRFTVCSISRDKTTMLTDCPDNAKCIIMWSLKTGTEITRMTRNDDVLSFAWSPDETLLAVSHSTGLICLFDVRDGFRTVAEHNVEKHQAFGMIRFSPDCRSLFCFHASVRSFKESYCLNVNESEHPSCLSAYPLDSPLSDWGANELDILLSQDSPVSYLTFDFVLDALTVLRGHPGRSVLDMLNINKVRSLIPWKTRPGVEPPLRPRAFMETLSPLHNFMEFGGMTEKVAFSLTGKTVYVIRTGFLGHTAWAWNVLSEETVGHVVILGLSCFEPRLKEGVLLSTSNGCLEMWNFELSNCIRRWPDLVQPRKITQTVPISEERVALISNNKVIFLNTTTSEIVSIPIDHGDFITCNSKCQLLTLSSGSVKLLDGHTILWKTDLGLPSHFDRKRFSGTFSLSEQFVVICSEIRSFGLGMYILDAFSGKRLHNLYQDCEAASDCHFVSDQECVVSFCSASEGSSLQLFNVESGEPLSVIHLERKVSHLAACPRKRLLAIDSNDCKLGVELIQVHLPRDKDNRKSKRRAVEIDK